MKRSFFTHIWMTRLSASKLTRMLDSHDTPGARPLIWIGLASFVLPANAHAYLDPGTGSLVLQAIIGFILAMGMTTKIWWRRSKRFFLRIIKHRQPTDTDGE